MEREEKKRRGLTLSNCLHAKLSSWLTGSRSITGREMDFIEDSIISAPYWFVMPQQTKAKKVTMRPVSLKRTSHC